MADKSVAVVAIAGQQFLISVGDVIAAPSLTAQIGDVVKFSNLLDSGQVKATVIGHGRRVKVSGRIFRNKVRSSRYPHGHRQAYTSLQIDAIPS